MYRFLGFAGSTIGCSHAQSGAALQGGAKVKHLALPCASASIAATACCAADSGFLSSAPPLLAAGDAAMLPAGASGAAALDVCPAAAAPAEAAAVSKLWHQCCYVPGSAAWQASGEAAAARLRRQNTGPEGSRQAYRWVSPADGCPLL